MSEPISYLETPWGQAVIEAEPDPYQPSAPAPRPTGFGAALPFLIGGLGVLAAILTVVSTLRPWLVIEQSFDAGFGGTGSASLRESVDPWGRLTLSGPAASGIDLQSGAHWPRYAVLMVAAALVLCAAGTAVVVFRGRIWPGLLGILGSALLLPAVAAPLVEWDGIRSQFGGQQGNAADVRLAGGVWIGAGAALLAIIVLGLSVDLVYRSVTARIELAFGADPSDDLGVDGELDGSTAASTAGWLDPGLATAPGQPGYDPFGTSPTGTWSAPPGHTP